MDSIDKKLEAGSHAAFAQALKNRTCVLFGTGKYARRAIEDLSDTVAFAYAIDNSFWKWDTKFSPQNITIKSPQALLEEDPNSIVVLIALKDFFEVAKQLVALGIQEYYAYPLFFEFLKTRYTDISISPISLTD